MYNFFSLMFVSFCIKEPLDFTRVHQIELKFSKFPGRGPPYPPRGSRFNHRNRCLSERVGSLLFGSFHGGSVVTPGANARTRTPCRSVCSQEFCQKQSTNENSLAHGQCLSSVLHQQDGGNQVPCSRSVSHRSLAMVSQPQFSVGGSSHSRGVECQSRSGVTNLARPQRLATISMLFSIA